MIKYVTAFQNHAPGNLNYEAVTIQDGQLRHWWRDWNNGKWYQGAALGNASGGVAAFQNHAPGNLNYEVIAVQDRQLRHWWRDWSTGKWYQGAILGNASGGAAAFQNHAPGNLNYEVIALQDGQLRHWWRDWSTGKWYQGAILGDASGDVTAFQNHAPGNLNYEVIALQDGHLRHWWRDWKAGQWYQGAVNDQKIGLSNSIVVCSSCAPALLAAKTRGIQEAMRSLINYCGADARAEICPITFHLDGDTFCGPYKDDMTGHFSLDSSGHGQVCLYDVEKKNRTVPFTVENAQKIEDQLLVVHEAMHGWFVGRQENYRIQEPFCKLVSFIVSKFSGGSNYCDWFKSTPDTHPDALMKYLCELGINVQQAAQILKNLAQIADGRGKPLTDAEFAGVVTTVLGRDAVPAFRSAGILP